MNDLVAKTENKYGMSTQGMSPGLALMFNDHLYERCKDMAKIMSEAKGMLPPHIIGKPHACFAIVTTAITWKLNPFQVAQSTYETPGGRVGYEGKLVQAILENSGPIVGGVTFEHIGDWTKIQGKWKKGQSSRGNVIPVQDWKDEDEIGLGVIVRAQVRGEDKQREFTMMLRECFPRNSTLWPIRPSQQICYTAVRAFANIAAPGIFMGVPFSTDLEEIEAMQDITPARPKRESFIEKMEASARDVAEITEEVDKLTGEITATDDQAADEAAEEYTVPDAMERGRQAYRDKKALRAVPPEWRDNPAFQKFAEAWSAGWRAEEEDQKSQS